MPFPFRSLHKQQCQPFFAEGSTVNLDNTDAKGKQEEIITQA